MAGIAAGSKFLGAQQTIAQLRAIAWLRWRILVNTFRRGNGVGEMIGRILLLPFITCLVLLPAALAGFFAWYLAMHGTLGRLHLLLWGAFVLAQLLNINLGQPGTAFDPLELIRFPISLRNYILVRLGFGLLSPANVVVTLMSVAIFIGLTLDRPALWPWTLLAMGTFAVANVLFSRMAFAWVDRWLSTRRAREIFTALIFLSSLGVQYLNIKFNTGLYQARTQGISHEKLHTAQTLANRLEPWLRWLPPELTGSAVVAAQRHHGLHAFEAVSLVALYAMVFLTVYSSRMRIEYRGENISDSANAVRTRSKYTGPSASSALHDDALSTFPADATRVHRGLWPASLAPQLSKELLLLRRNTGLLYGVIAPIVMVFLFAGRLSVGASGSSVLLVAAGYALMGLGPMSYNSFGAEGPGAQLYFLAPVPLRDVFLAKNIMHFLLAIVELCAVICLVTYLTRQFQLVNVLFVVFWAAATLLLNTFLGNLRSISAPKKVKPGRSFQRAQSQLSVWISIGVFAACAALGLGFQLLSRWMQLPWLGLALVALFAGLALFTYGQGLRGIDAYAVQRRESLFEELGKKS